MRRSSFEVRHIRWWHKPVPLLVRRNGDHIRVGWVWNQWAYLVNNLHDGWIAFAEDQTPENIDIWKCNHCGASLWVSQRFKIEAAIKETNAQTQK